MSTREDLREDLYIAISDKCYSNDQKWGGPDHDDQHSRRDWIAFIVRQLGDAERCADQMGIMRFQEQMIAVAALAIQAIESVDRVAAGEGK